MDEDIKIGKANGGVFVLVSIVKWLFQVAVVVAVVGLFMCYVLNMGQWRFKAIGVTVVDIAAFALKASVILGIAYSVVFKPLALLARKSILKKVLYADLVGLSERDVYEIRFIERMINSTTIAAVISGVLSGAAAVLAHDPLMSSLGNPAADIITLAIIAIGPLLLGMITVPATTSGLKREDPQLYEQGINLLSQV